MGKNILVLTGSARKNGNSSLMADAFIKGAEASGHNVFRFDAGTKAVNGCINCDTCFSKGEDKACSFDDAFNEAAPYLINYDVIVFCTPLYWYTFPSQIKAVIDKIYSLMVAGKESKIKECLLLVCGECDNERFFEGIVKSYELIAGDRKWKDLGRFIVTGVVKPGDVSVGDHLAKIEDMGHNL